MRISIITVSYNSSATIEKTLESVQAQGYSNLEYIIVDGYSKDSTLEIVGRYSDVVKECISEPDQGIYDAMNKGIYRSTGQIIGILNSDDFYFNNCVLDQVAECFASDPELDVVLGDVDFVNENDLSSPVRCYSSANFKPWMFRFGLMPPHPAAFIRKSAYERVGVYKLGYTIAADFDLFTRLLLLDGAKYMVAQKTWVRMRMGGASTSGFASIKTITSEMSRSLQENHIYTNQLMLLCRLPFKLLTQRLFK